MISERIAYEQTGLFSRIILDYLAGRDDLKSFYGRAPKLESFQEQLLEKASQQVDRKTLKEVISAQYEGLQMSELQRTNLNSLSSNQTFCVTTGHQLCLFSGPSYFIYKICSAIKLAKQLNETMEGHVIPIFWMASEDHDLQEVNHTYVFGKKIEWNAEQGGAVGEMSLDSIDESLLRLQEILGEGDKAKEFLSIMRNAYVKRGSLTEATRVLIQELFAEYGLLCVDGNDSRLKSSFRAIMEQEVFEGFVQSTSKGTIEALKKRGAKVQANPRSINLFYMTEGQRRRIEPEGDDFRIVETDMLFDARTMKEMLYAHPERFSPNVLMRPVYQEFILPCLAYVGGGGELAYWLELKEVFSALEVTYPILVLRNSIMLMDSRSVSSWSQLGFETADLFRDTHQLEKECALKNQSEELSIIADKQRVLHAFKKIQEKSIVIDKSMTQFTESEMRKLEKSINAIEKKVIKAEKKKSENDIAKLNKIKSSLIPGGALQERKENIARHYLSHGRELIPMLIHELEPLEPQLTVLKFSE